jgi:hypothetical protein
MAQVKAAKSKQIVRNRDSRVCRRRPLKTESPLMLVSPSARTPIQDVPLENRRLVEIHLNLFLLTRRARGGAPISFTAFHLLFGECRRAAGSPIIDGGIQLETGDM